MTPFRRESGSEGAAKECRREAKHHISSGAKSIKKWHREKNEPRNNGKRGTMGRAEEVSLFAIVACQWKHQAFVMCFSLCAQSLNLSWGARVRRVLPECTLAGLLRRVSLLESGLRARPDKDNWERKWSTLPLRRNILLLHLS